MTHTGMAKAGEIGGGQDVPFEQAMSNLAHSYMKDKAPGLMDYEVGFQLVDRNQENTKAVGCFGFKVGTQWLLAPVFFLNGDLKGHELLYVKNQDAFLPLKENWLNYLLNRRPHVMGEGVDKNLTQLGVMPPHLYQISRSPHKFAAETSAVPEWFREHLPDVGDWVTGDPWSKEKYASVPDLPSFVKSAGEPALRALLATMRLYPKIAAAVEEFHGLAWVDEAVAAAKEARSVKAAELFHAGGDIPGKRRPHTIVKKTDRPGGFIEFPKDAAGDKGDPKDKVRVVRESAGNVGLSEDEKKKLILERVVVRDAREDDDVSVAYKTQTRIDLTNPDITGLYEILFKPGEFRKCIVVANPYGRLGRRNFFTVIPADGEKDWLNVHPSQLWSRKVYAKEDGTAGEDWFETAKKSDAAGLDKGKTYIVITPRGESTCPFDVKYVTGTVGGVTTYEVSYHDYAEIDRAGYLPRLDPTHFADRDLNNDYGYAPGRQIVFTGKYGTALMQRGSTTYVPNGCAVLTLSGDGSESPSGRMRPGNLSDAELLLFNKLGSLDVRHAGPFVSLNGEEMTADLAFERLITVIGLREKQARSILDEAKAVRHACYWVKYADPYLTRTGLSAPSFPDQAVGYDPMTGNNVPTQHVQEHNLPVRDLSSGLTDPQIYAPMNVNPVGVGSTPDHSSVQTAMRAAESGQKEVFDTAMLGSLLKATKDESMVDRYLGDLMKGLDRLGRILFLFYWHQDNFEDRYGKGDLPELEDGLRNAFEAVGDIVLFLKQKTVDPNPDEMGGRVDLGSIANM